MLIIIGICHTCQQQASRIIVLFVIYVIKTSFIGYVTLIYATYSRVEIDLMMHLAGNFVLGEGWFNMNFVKSFKKI